MIKWLQEYKLPIALFVFLGWLVLASIRLLAGA